MEDDDDGLKGEAARPGESKFVAKAGWVKKSSGKLLGSYKNRYVLVDKTEIVVYEKEDSERCIERVDLGKYDRCCGAKGPFQKNRLVLIPAPKSKVHDVKLQIPNSQEKEAWIKALSDAIGRAKNKIFDEVKIDESSSLEHVTRTRPKGNRSRRPPTRIHMKEVASVSSEGILRLDLDTADSTPNGTYPLGEEAAKPPVPPSKDSEAQQQQQQPESSQEANSETTVPKPPVPPSKDSEPAARQAAEPLAADDQGSTEESISIMPTPEETRRPSEEKDAALNVVPSTSSEGLQPPTPPSEDTEPTSGEEVPTSAESPEEERADGLLSEAVPSAPSEQTRASETSAPLPINSEREHPALATAERGPAGVLEESAPSEKEPTVASSAVTEPEEASQEPTAPPIQETPEPSSRVSESPGQLAEPVKKHPGPPAPPKKKPPKPPVVTGYVRDVPTASSDSSELGSAPTLDDAATCAKAAAEALFGTEIPIRAGGTVSADSSETPPPSSDADCAASDEEDAPKSEEGAAASPKLKRDTLMLVLSDYDTGDLLDLAADREEPRSSDSGQHSDDESESADDIGASTIALSGSRAHLDEDVGEDDADFVDGHTLGLERGSDNPVARKHKGLRDTPDGEWLQRLSQSCPPLLALSPSLVKRKSRSAGDLLSSAKLVEEPSPSLRSRETGEPRGTAGPAPNADAFLRTLPGKESEAGSALDGGAPSEVSPRELSAAAGLRKAERVLREADGRKDPTRRPSW